MLFCANSKGKIFGRRYRKIFLKKVRICLMYKFSLPCQTEHQVVEQGFLAQLVIKTPHKRHESVEIIQRFLPIILCSFIYGVGVVELKLGDREIETGKMDGLAFLPENLAGLGFG